MDAQQSRDPAQKKFGLALGGGGSRAICHLGVIAALEKAGIHIDCIAGNSMGGIIGGLYATGCGLEATRDGVFSCFGKGGLVRMRKGDGLEREKGVLAFLKRNFSFLSFLLTPLQYLKRDLRALFISLNLSFRRGFIWRNPCKKAVNAILPDINIEELALPFAVVVMNLTDGRLESLTSGPLREPVIAGTNVGVVFPPYRWNGKEYVDAAPVCSLPVDEVRALGAEVVLAVDIRTPLPENFRVLNGFDTIFRIEMMESGIINDQRAARAELVIRPETGPLFWGDFSRNDEVVRAGEEAVEQILPRLRELLF